MASKKQAESQQVGWEAANENFLGGIDLAVAQGKGIDAKIIKPQWNGPRKVWDSRYARLTRHGDGRPLLGWGGVA